MVCDLVLDVLMSEVWFLVSDLLMALDDVRQWTGRVSTYTPYRLVRYFGVRGRRTKYGDTCWPE